MVDNTVFDSVFKTMAHKMPQLMVPFINEAFDRSYPQDTPVVSFNDEHETLRGTVIDDTVFRLGDKIYHIECQSTPDHSMVIRMIEYDFAIALESALDAGEPYELEFPASCVLFLRHSSHTPDELVCKVRFPDGAVHDYRTKVIKAQQYGNDELFEKRLLLLTPFYLMRYERELSRLARGEAELGILMEDCVELRSNLEELTLQSGDTLLYEQLIELIIRVVDHLFAADDALRKRVRKAMGGEVLELMHERAKRLEREAEARGIEQGIERGIEQGIEQGIERGIEQGIVQGIERGIEQGTIQGARDLAGLLGEQGVDPEILRSALEQLGIPQE